MPVIFPDELEGGLIGVRPLSSSSFSFLGDSVAPPDFLSASQRNTAARNLVSNALRQAGIDQNSRLLSRSGSGSIQQQRVDLFSLPSTR